MKTVLTIAGSDCSGGAGIEADIKTITAHKMYAMSAITALTAQNTTGVTAIHEIPPEFLAQQLDQIFTDIRPDAIKIGMVSSEAPIEVIAQKLKQYACEKVVLDPVMISTSGKPLLQKSAVAALVARLFPLAAVITPNLAEAAALTGSDVQSRCEITVAARRLSMLTPAAILIKGGHLEKSCDDLLLEGGCEKWFSSPRIDNPNTHGTGCTLSSAIACGLAAGLSISDSVAQAKAYITGAINARLDLGRGSGPLNHCWSL